MSRKRQNRVLAGIVLIGFFIVLTPGCDKYTKHKVLTFFFTGVPPLEEEKKTGVQEIKVAENQLEKNKKKIRKFIPKVRVFIHGPKAAGQCYQCHETSTSAGLRKTGKKKAGGGPRIGQGIPGRLVAPLKGLCVECHIYKSVERAYKEDSWLHGPVADSNCTLCHSPHQSANLYMLLKRPEEICIQCHSEGYIVDTDVHREAGDCLLCHNAHRGNDRLLLRKDYNEVF